MTISPSGSGGSVLISPANSVTISPAGSGVTISPTGGGVTISPSGSGGVVISPFGNLTLGAGGSSATTISSALPGNINNLRIGQTNRQAGAFTTVEAYDTSFPSTSTTDFRRARFSWTGGDFFIETSASGGGTVGFNHLNLKTAAGKQIRFHGGSGAANIWNFDAGGHFTAASDNTYDIGATATARPRFIHVGRTIVSGVASPAQITAHLNNYNPDAQGKYLRLATDTSRNITGLTFTTAQVDGEEHLIVNIGANPIVLINESGSSLVGNRFLNTTNADITLNAGEQAMCWYDGAVSRWRVSKCN